VFQEKGISQLPWPIGIRQDGLLAVSVPVGFNFSTRKLTTTEPWYDHPWLIVPIFKPLLRTSVPVWLYGREDSTWLWFGCQWAPPNTNLDPVGVITFTLPKDKPPWSELICPEIVCILEAMVGAVNDTLTLVAGALLVLW